MHIAYDKRMNIAVIAADGRLGRAFVDEALARGHHVRGGVRGNQVTSWHENLEIVQCDATNSTEASNLIKDQDVVVSCIGHVKNSPADVQTTATRVVIEAMNQLGVKRFVDLTGTGARFPGDKITLIDWFLNLSVKFVDPTRVKDGVEHMKVLSASDVEWTTIRVLKLQNVPAKPYSLLLNGPTKPFVGRDEAAKAMLEVIENHTFVKQSPIIGRS
jgi:putative NADH-flavin reductase